MKNVFLLALVACTAFASCNKIKKELTHKASSGKTLTNQVIEESGNISKADVGKVLFDYSADWTFTPDSNIGKYDYDSHSVYQTANPYNSIALYIVNKNGKNVKPENRIRDEFARETFTELKKIDTYGNYKGEGILAEVKRNGKDMEVLLFSAVQGDSVLFSVRATYPKGKKAGGFDIIEKSLKIK